MRRARLTRSVRLVVAAIATGALSATLLADGLGTGGGPGLPGGSGAAEPTDEEQHVIWELNRARRDPPTYGASIGLDLTGIAPRPPLAVSRLLTGSAHFKTQEMYDHGYFAHVSPVTGKGANQLAADAGYDVFGSGLLFPWGSANNLESLAHGETTFSQALADLIIDADPSQQLGHRIHLLALHPFYEKHREIGAGKAQGSATGAPFHAIHTAYVHESDLFLTGVVFTDQSGEGGFDVTEGMSGVSIDLGGGLATRSLAAGGWSIPVSPGTYTVKCAGGAFQGVAFAKVTVTASNHEIDFASGRSWGLVDFGTPMGPQLFVGSSVDLGPAALDVTFSAASNGPPATFAWDFGDGAIAAGAMPEHEYAAPGAYVVRVKAMDANGTDAALTAVCATGAGGAGPATFEPFSHALKIVGCKATSKFAASGKDVVTFTGKIEMPGGWTRGLAPATVVLAGVKASFPLAGKDKFRNAAGNAFTLTYKHKKHGAPIGAGVKAKVTVTLRGDFRSVLDDLGLRNEPGSRTLQQVPFIVMLGDTGWTGRANLAVTSTPNVVASAALSHP